LEVLPGDAEAPQVLPEAVHVVGRGAARARGGEENAASLGEAPGLQAHGQRVFELGPLEAFEEI